MNPSRRLGRWHTLDAVHPGLVLEPGVGAFAFDHHYRFLDPAHAGLGEVGHGHAPAPHLGVPGVHAQDFGGEQGRLLPAGPGTDLEDDVAMVIGIGRQEQNLDRGRLLDESGAEGSDLFLGHRP